MIPLSTAWKELATRLGTKRMGQKDMTRSTRMEMCSMAIRQKISNERYRRYAEAKRRIPMNLPPKEYEEEVRRLARKYKI